MCFTCYNGIDAELTACVVFSYGLIPFLAMTSLTLNGFTLYVLFLIKLPSSQQRPFECFLIAQIMSAISALTSVIVGHSGWVLHVAFFSLSGYLLFTMLIGGWCHLSMPLEFPQIRSSVFQYAWIGFAVVWNIVPVLSFIPETRYDLKTATWALERDSDFVVIFFWYLHRVLPEVLIAFFVIWIKVESQTTMDDKRIALSLQVLGSVFFVANIPSIVNCITNHYDRDDTFHSVQMFMEILSTNATFITLYFLNPDFSQKVIYVLKNLHLPFRKSSLRSTRPVPYTPTPYVRKRNTVKLEAIELEGMIQETQENITHDERPKDSNSSKEEV